MISLNSTPSAGASCKICAGGGPVRRPADVKEKCIVNGDDDVRLREMNFLGQIATDSGGIATSRGSVLRVGAPMEPLIRSVSGRVDLRRTELYGDVVAGQGDIYISEECKVFGDVLQGPVALAGVRAGLLHICTRVPTARIYESAVRGTVRGCNLRVRNSHVDRIELDGFSPALKGDEARLLLSGECSINAIHGAGPCLVIVEEPSALAIRRAGADMALLDMSPQGAYDAVTAADRLPTLNDPLDLRQWRRFQHALYALCELSHGVPGVDSFSWWRSVVRRANDMAQLLLAWTRQDVNVLIERLSSVRMNEDLTKDLAAIGLMLLSSPPSRAVDQLIGACGELAREHQVLRGHVRVAMSRMEGGEPHNGVIQPRNPPVLALAPSSGMRAEAAVSASLSDDVDDPLAGIATCHWPADKLPPVFRDFWKAIHWH
ncbi:hypothetical protein SAMN05216359_10356 [Roseateles sp. YR242]|uniref:hypothetical protein n=1 Tax=Roseateles sp. YR242 TaxID=1855305 RepID=UPI0008B4CAE4|nr:hypothetical protein [Roseateles sp. YR242]SEK78128.1 hypothetical protein SAMN05216359_10356 [Roseateles sp. YR242]